MPGNTSTLDVAAFPEELRSRRQWVNWRFENRGQKPTKVPYCAATGRAASATNPETWTSFQGAIHALESGKWDGLGFVFSAADPYCGIDLDQSVEASGGVKPWAQEILDLLPAGTYAEISPSGRGLHVLIRAKKPGSKCRTSIEDGAIEIYDSRRFFTMTGNLLTESSQGLTEGQTALDTIYHRFLAPPPNPSSSGSIEREAELLRRIFASKNGETIRALWAGDWSGYKSESEADLALCSHLAYWTDGDEARIGSLFRQSGLMRDKWERGDYRRRTISKALSTAAGQRNGKTAQAKLDQGRGNSRQNPPADHLVQIEPLDPLDKAKYPATDRANAGRLASHFKRDLCFIPGLGYWIFDGSRWRASQTQAERLAGRLGRIISEEAAELSWRAARIDDETVRTKLLAEAKTLLTWAQRSEQGSAIRESLNLARGLLEIEPERFDNHDFLLNLENGTLDLDLTTGEFRQHSPEDLLTKLAPVRFDRQAVAPRWQAFIDQVMGGSVNLARYLQRVSGYSITGSVAEQCMFFCHGQGQNGKSTFLNVLRQVMGPDYVLKAAPDLLMASCRDRAHPTEIADLRGARIVVSQEVDQWKPFDTQKLKELTGERFFKARFMHQDFFTFRGGFKIWLAANHLPPVDEQTDALWRRIHLIPFTVKIENPIKDFDCQLAQESSGILNWLIEGLHMYREMGLSPPQEVVGAVDAYRADSDSLGLFVAECCVRGDRHRVNATELWDAYCEFCRGNDFEPIRRRQFKPELSNRDFGKADRRSRGIFYVGLSLGSPSGNRGETTRGGM